MSLRKFAKKAVYRYCPGLAGSFPYFDTRVYFPRDAFIFDIVCQEGIYEQEILKHIQGVITPGSWYFDVGANIGLMSVPILKMQSDIHVMSFEPSRNSQRYLQRTWNEFQPKDRWKVVFKAVGDHVGDTNFSLSPQRFGGYDGMKNTNRSDSAGTMVVPMTTLDEEWKAVGRPPVSCVKLDVEGAELQVLAGAEELIQTTRPYVFLEWYRANFECFGCEGPDLLKVAEHLGYQLAVVPNLNVVQTESMLSFHMRVTASFVLVPSSRE